MAAGLAPVQIAGSVPVGDALGVLLVAVGLVHAVLTLDKLGLGRCVCERDSPGLRSAESPTVRDTRRQGAADLMSRRVKLGLSVRS